jgi:hypothetical protein
VLDERRQLGGGFRLGVPEMVVRRAGVQDPGHVAERTVAFLQDRASGAGLPSAPMDLAQIVAATRDVVRETEPDRLGDPTPCAEWDVRRLTGHVFQVVTAVLIAGRGEPVPAALWSQTLTGADFDAAAKPWDPPPAEMVDMGGMPMPAQTVRAMLGADLAWRAVPG